MMQDATGAAVCANMSLYISHITPKSHTELPQKGIQLSQGLHRFDYFTLWSWWQFLNRNIFLAYKSGPIQTCHHANVVVEHRRSMHRLHGATLSKVASIQRISSFDFWKSLSSSSCNWIRESSFFSYCALNNHWDFCYLKKPVWQQ